MKANRIISPWKTVFLGICFACMSTAAAFGQCNVSLHSVTYDTLVTGSGNDPHSFTIKKFDASLGTLLSVDIQSVVSVNYGFTLTNINTSPISFSVRVGRKDNIQSSLLSAPYNNTIMAPIGTYNLDPNQSVTENPTTIINRYVNSLNISDNISGFVGSNSVLFQYAPRTYASNSGSPTYNYSATANDSIHFFVTYNYRDNIVRIPGMNEFSANKSSNESAKLNWDIVNEESNRAYEVQRSFDMLNFTDVGVISSTACDSSHAYTFNYFPTKNERQKLYFRVKITGANSVISYSTIKMVDFTDYSTGIRLYPNPSDRYINLKFNQSDLKNWQVDIIGASGSLLQRNIFVNTSLAHIDFVNPLAAGVYFIRAVDQQTQQSHVLSFTVR